MPTNGARGPLQFDDVVVDPGAMRVTKGGVRVELEPKAFDVLLHLVERPGQLVTKQALIAEVWKGVAVTDNVLTRCIAQLRRGLGDVAKESKYIETVPTRGYRFVGTLRAPDAQPVAAPPPDSPQATGRTDHPWLRRLSFAAALLAVAGIGSAWLLYGVSPRAAGDAPAATVAHPRQITFSQGLDVYPDFSPDGRLLAYATSAHGAMEIEVRPTGSEGRPQRITSDGRGNIQPRWSPDGQYLAYHSMALGGVWVVPALGGTPRRVAAVGAGAVWSPDGRTIAFQSGEPSVVEISGTPPPSELFALDVASGAVRSITTRGRPVGGHAEPAWSPNGELIAFLARFPTGTEIWTVRPDGGRPVRTWECPIGSCFGPRFLPDGRALIVPVAGRGYLELPIDPATGARVGEPKLLLSQRGAIGGHLAVSADGRLLAVADLTLRSELNALPLDKAGRAGGEPRSLTDETGRSTTPAFSPDGSRLAFQARRDGAEIRVLRADGTQPLSLPMPPGFRGGGGRPGWLSNEEVLWSAVGDRGTALIATRVDSRESRLVRLLGPWPMSAAQYMAVRAAAGGRTIVFSRDDGSTTSVWTMDLETGTERRLTPPTEAATFPVASPDGRWLAYERVEDGSMHLVVAPMAGGAGRQLTSGRGLTWPHSWSADGSRLMAAMRRGGTWSIGWISRETGETTTLLETQKPNQWLRYPEVSPRGDRVVFEQSETRGNIWLVPRQSTERRTN